MPTKAFKHPLLLFQQLEKKLVREGEIYINQDTEQNFCSQRSPRMGVFCLTEVSLNGRDGVHWRHTRLRLQEKSGAKPQGE